MSIPKYVVAIIFMSPLMLVAQTAAPSPAGTTTGGGTSFFTPTAPSDILERSLDELRNVVGSLKLEKWKRGTVRDEAGTNVDAIQRDLQGTLPALLKNADAAPGTLSKVLPLSRNVDALYDVLVHVVEASRVVASGDQVGQLQQALADLEKARVVLDTQIQQTADAQEKQMVELRTTVQSQAASLHAAATPPPAPKCPAPAPAKKKRPAPKPNASGAKPAAGTPSTPASNTTPAKPQ